MITLCVSQASIVSDALDVCIQPGARLQRRTLCPAVEKDVEVDLELTDLFLKADELLIDLRGFVLL